ncbi:MAG: hypothetical protein CM15mP52_2340 [Candidatus Neomarinimicrobiota bacterium]|nr:MAG: hypothetical protein CM15mP52_2340 [Candidatus Neomarinimicrobiota bacterium]
MTNSPKEAVCHLSFHLYVKRCLILGEAFSLSIPINQNVFKKIDTTWDFIAL